MKILLTESIASSGTKILEDSGFEVVYPADLSESGLIAAVSDCHGILVRGVAGDITESVLGAGANLRVVARHGVGLDSIDVEACRRLGIRVTNTPVSNVVSVAEHTMALILSVVKNLRNCDVQVRRGNFGARRTHYGSEVQEKTLGLIGLGRIGLAVAQRARLGLGMKVLGHDEFLPVGAEGEDVVRVDMDTVLRSSDVLSLHVPLNGSTRGMIDEFELAKMKNDAFLINCSRGGVVKEQALVDALEDGLLAGAGLDVFAEEPVPSSHALMGLDNVVLTPHIAAHSVEALDRVAEDAARGIIDVLAGREPSWPVV